MAYQHLATEELARKVEERKKFLKKIVEFTEKLLLKRGKILLRVEANYHTRTVRKLEGFAHFTFLADWGQTDCGGNTVKIWYHPHFEHISQDITRPVLYVDYQSVVFNTEDCKVRTFDQDQEWQTAIEEAIKNKKSILAEMARPSRKRGGKNISTEQQDQRVRLERDAEKLGI